MKLGAVLLAAGRSSRFGQNKLLVDFCGRPMVCHALDALQALHAARRAVVCADEQVADLARASGCTVIENREPERGQAHSIALGVGATLDMDAVLLLAGDQPRLAGASLRRLAERFEASGKGIACLQDDTHLGNPAVFARRYFPALLALDGDTGAKGILRAHADDLLIVPCLRTGELADADTPQALERLHIMEEKA